MDPAYPVCAQKVEFLQVRWQSDPCYAFYGVDGTTCSILTYLSQVEDFCPPRLGRNHTALISHDDHTQAEIRTTLRPLYEAISNNSGLAMKFIRARVERMSERWTQAGVRMNKTQPFVWLCLPAGSVGQRFEAMVERGGPLGELVQWADLSCSFLNLLCVFCDRSSLIGAAPGRGSCPIQRPITFDLIYTDYHGLAHLQGAMGLAFQHYQCHFRILDSFGTEPVFNSANYARSHGYKTLWGSWGLQPLQYMTMFPHTPDNSFLGFVSEEGLCSHGERNNLCSIFSLKKILLETCKTSIKVPKKGYNMGPLRKYHVFPLSLQLFVGLGFPYEGPAPIEAIALGCIFLQPRFDPPHSSENNDFYKGKPTTRQISSQHPYAEEFIGKPYVWSVDVTNSTEIREAIRAILSTESFTPQEFTCVGMLERVHGYITHQNFCSKSAPTWPPESALKVHLGPLGQSCVSVCRRSSLLCEPALFHHLNTLSATVQEVNHLFPSYSPWGRHCGLQQEPLLFSCAGSDPSYRRLCPCRVHLPGQVALCPDCL
uniref:alpha-1,6-mannosyl-glycoprotein 6-beta-N-acetylglucosaminyltransferase n=1 Tax=Amphiprion percula TaxID=161767 RepID=A0A3P8SH68_AMPPE